MSFYCVYDDGDDDDDGYRGMEAVTLIVHLSVSTGACLLGCLTQHTLHFGLW